MFDKLTSEDLTAESDAFWAAKELQIWELRQEAIMAELEEKTKEENIPFCTWK